MHDVVAGAPWCRDGRVLRRWARVSAHRTPSVRSPDSVHIRVIVRMFRGRASQGTSVRVLIDSRGEAA